MARPHKPEDEVKANVLRIRMTEADRAVLDRAAQDADEETSTWAREALLELAKRTLRRKRSSVE